jgi:catechol 2,3-dioxygenase-like lactoylglutathione lyase family enzyme
MEQIIAKLLGDFERGKMTRRQLIQALAMMSTAGSAVVGVQTVAAKPATALSINHVSLRGKDYAKSRDFYSSLLGMKITQDDGRSARLQCGDNILLVRSQSSQPDIPFGVDHIAYTVEGWDKDKNVRAGLEAAIKRRGFDLYTKSPDSIFTHDPDGFEVQMGGSRQ